LICARCNLPVEKNAESYEVFERMHWLCFHLEFEHQGDPDEPCGDPAAADGFAVRLACTLGA
ncbi:hypothetical protein, partial [Roseateles sp. P5_E11]